MTPSTHAPRFAPRILLVALVAVIAAVAAPTGVALVGAGVPAHASGNGTLGPLAGGRCWAYTQAGRTTTQIEAQAQALAASPCDVDSWVFHWSVLEPVRGQYNWQLVDAAIQDSAATGRTVVLRVLAGITSPAWVASAARMVTIPAGATSRAGVMPVPWNRGFLHAWETFISAYGARYDGNAHIGLIETAGTGIYGESYLPGGLALWTAAGYTEARYLASTEAVVTRYIAAFQHTYVALDVSTGVNGSNENVMVPLVSWVTKQFPTRTYAQQNGLSGTSPPGRQAVITAPLFGLQMLGPTSQSRTGNLCTAFATALTDGAAYVEVYYADATNPADYAALDYLKNGDASATC
jgi:Beta-galactosidase